MADAAPQTAAPTAAKPAAPPQQSATPAKPEVAPVVETAPKRKLKVNGQEREVSEEEFSSAAQKFFAGEDKLKEAAELKKSAESDKQQVARVVAAVKKGDVKALRAEGFSDDEIETLSITYLSEKQKAALEQERVKGLDPKERELEELRREKAERQAKEKEGEDAKHADEVKKTEQVVTKSVIDTLEEFPEQYRRSEMVAQRVFDAWAYFYEHQEEIAKRGIEVTPKYIAGKVREELRALSREMIGSSSDDELEQYVPEPARDRLFKRVQSAAKKAAHPALGGEPQVRKGRGAEDQEEKPRLTAAQIARRSYFPKAS
jgi:hypothetical protein